MIDLVNQFLAVGTELKSGVGLLQHFSKGSVATLQSPRGRLAGCSSWRLRFAVYSSGGNSNRRSSCWRWAGTCASLCPTATSRSSLLSVDFWSTTSPFGDAARRFLVKALGGANHPAPRVINTDEHAGYPPAIERLKAEGALNENCQHRPVQYLNNVLEQDHRAIKRRVRASQHFRSFWGAWRTIAGYEAIHMIRKGQAWWSAAGAKVGLLHHFILGLFAATS